MNDTRPARIVHPAQASSSRAASLWFGILVGPAAWMVQELLGWFFGERVCGAMSIAGVRTTLAVISVAALAAAVAGAMTGWRNLRRATAGGRPLQTEGADRVEFMSMAGVLVSSVFALGIVWASLPAVMLNQCGHTR
jgi:hypothetical protein